MGSIKWKLFIFINLLWSDFWFMKKFLYLIWQVLKMVISLIVGWLIFNIVLGVWLVVSVR